MRKGLGQLALGAAVALATVPALAQTPPRPGNGQPAGPRPPETTASPAIPPLTPAQETAVLLGRWETCIDLSAQFLAYSALGQRKSTANVVRKCSGFEAQLRPVLQASLVDMMYGSSEQQVADQTTVAIESLRRHIQARAAAAVRARRERR
jgi:hypothetical protein